jgi:hypothetical protein
VTAHFRHFRVPSDGLAGLVGAVTCNVVMFISVPFVCAERESTLEAIEACWIAVRMDGEKPPETSVPRPTYISGSITKEGSEDVSQYYVP